MNSRNVSFNIPRYLLLLVFPFGAALILSFIYFIIDAEQMMEIDENIRALLNDYIDLHNSVYIAVTSVNVSAGDK
jgi:ABC-type spermidine/putrescine transport system permease subunit I